MDIADEDLLTRGLYNNMLDYASKRLERALNDEEFEEYLEQVFQAIDDELFEYYLSIDIKH